MMPYERNRPPDIVIPMTYGGYRNDFFGKCDGCLEEFQEDHLLRYFNKYPRSPELKLSLCYRCITAKRHKAKGRDE